MLNYWKSPRVSAALLWWHLKGIATSAIGDALLCFLARLQGLLTTVACTWKHIGLANGNMTQDLQRHLYWDTTSMVPLMDELTADGNAPYQRKLAA